MLCNMRLDEKYIQSRSHWRKLYDVRTQVNNPEQGGAAQVQRQMSICVESDWLLGMVGNES